MLWTNIAITHFTHLLHPIISSPPLSLICPSSLAPLPAVPASQLLPASPPPFSRSSYHNSSLTHLTLESLSGVWVHFTKPTNYCKITGSDLSPKSQMNTSETHSIYSTELHTVDIWFYLLKCTKCVTPGHLILYQKCHCSGSCVT